MKRNLKYQEKTVFVVAEDMVEEEVAKVEDTAEEIEAGIEVEDTEEIGVGDDHIKNI